MQRGAQLSPDRWLCVETNNAVRPLQVEHDSANQELDHRPVGGHHVAARQPERQVRHVVSVAEPALATGPQADPSADERGELEAWERPERVAGDEGLDGGSDLRKPLGERLAARLAQPVRHIEPVGRSKIGIDDVLSISPPTANARWLRRAWNLPGSVSAPSTKSVIASNSASTCSSPEGQPAELATADSVPRH
jgi:hypothetical protein